MKKIIILLMLVLLQNLSAQNQPPVVSNVTFSQRQDSSFIVDVHYDLSDSDNATVTVTVKASSNEGQTWNFSADSISGDTGDGVTVGAGKHIVWNFGAEHPQFYSDKIKIKIIADDGYVDTLSCPGIPTLTYAGKTYHTVQIGAQCWLKENLDVGTMIISDGDHTGSQQTDNGIIEKYCYDNYAANCNTYGGLYEWNEAMQYVTTESTQGICPVGWHIPTKTEFITLQTYVNNQAVKLIDESQTMRNGLTPTNETGFSALIAGHRHFNGYFLGLSYYTNIWSSTESGSYAGRMYLYYAESVVFFYNHSKNFGYSVRCLKD